MTTLTIDRRGRQTPPPRTPLHLVAPAPEPCNIAWCVQHDDYGNLCAGTQTNIGDHAVALTRSDEDPGTILLVSVFKEISVPMTPAEALAFADEMVEFARILAGRAQLALADPMVIEGPWTA